MSKPPAFQFYPADFLSDENVAMMSNQEIGCYIKLMCYCWREGSIPADTDKIARLCGEDSSAMAQLWHSLERCFDSAIDNPLRLVNPRLESERNKQEKFKKERAESGKKGAKLRWNRELDSNSSAMAKPIAQPIANDSSSSSSSSSNNTPIAPKGASDSAKLKAREIEQNAAAIYLAYPLKVGKPAALKAITRQLATIPFETLLELTQRYAASRKGDLSFTPHPATWFNQQRFNDDPITWTHSASSTTTRPGPNRNAGNSNANVASQYKLH